MNSTGWKSTGVVGHQTSCASLVQAHAWWQLPSWGSGWRIKERLSHICLLARSKGHEMLFQKSYTYILVFCKFGLEIPKISLKGNIYRRLYREPRHSMQWRHCSGQPFFLQSLTNLKYFFCPSVRIIISKYWWKTVSSEIVGVQMNPPKGARAPHWSRSAPFLKNTIPGKSALFKQNC